MFVDVEGRRCRGEWLKESGDVRRMDDYIFWNAGSEIGYYPCLARPTELHASPFLFFFFRSEKKKYSFVELDS